MLELVLDEGSGRRLRLDGDGCVLNERVDGKVVTGVRVTVGELPIDRVRSFEMLLSDLVDGVITREDLDGEDGVEREDVDGSDERVRVVDIVRGVVTVGVLVVGMVFDGPSWL